LGKNVVTSGGRVLTVSALGETIEDARLKAYANIERINFKQSCYRKDIALFS
jgi:phosphoribosylamine--glycine ligase